MARRATEANIAEFASKRADLEKAAAEKLAAAQGVGEKLAGLSLQVPAKAGVDGRLFGSVTNHDIADALGKQGFKVEKSQVRLPNGPLKTIGDFPASIALHSDVVTDITVSVLGEHA